MAVVLAVKGFLGAGISLSESGYDRYEVPSSRLSSKTTISVDTPPAKEERVSANAGNKANIKK